MNYRIKKVVLAELIGIVICLGIWDGAMGKDFEDYYEEGTKAYNAGYYQDAIRAWKNGLSLVDHQGNKQDQGAFLMSIGVAYKKLRHYDKALQYYQDALSIRREIGDIEGEGANLRNIGLLYLDLGKFNEALFFFQKALPIRQKLGYLKGECLDLEGIGLAYYNLGKYDEALSSHLKSLAIRRKTADLKGEEFCLTNIGLVYSALGEYRKALSHYQNAFDIAEKIGDLSGKGTCLVNISTVCLDLGEYEKALSYSQEALAIMRKIDDAKGEGDCFGNIGIIYDVLGQYQDALLYHQKALALYRKFGDLKGEATVLGNIGLSYHSLGEYEKALSNQQESLAIKREIGDKGGEGNSLANIGLVYLNLGQYEKALSSYLKSLAIHSEIGNLKGKGVGLMNIGTIYEILGQHENALSYYRAALDIAKKIGDAKGEGDNLANIGNAYFNLGQYQKSLSYYQKSMDSAKKIGDAKGEGDSSLKIGNVYYSLEQYQKALLSYQESLGITRKIGDVRGEGMALNNMGVALLSDGKPAKAEIQLESAIEVWESIRGQVKTGRERTGFQSTLPDVYANLAAARLSQGDQLGAFEALERGRSKSFLDLLGTRGVGKRRSKEKTAHIATIETQLSGLLEKHVKLASAPMGAKTRSALEALNQQISELDRQRLELIEELRRTDPELGSLTVVDPPALKEIQSLIPNRVTLVEYFHPGKHTISGKDQEQLWIFVVHSSGLHFKAVDVSESDLEKTLEQYAKLVSDGSSDFKVLESVGAKLHEWLIQPVEPVFQLVESDTVVIVPWGPMFKLPFSALGRKRGKPFCTGKNVLMVPSAGVYRHLAKRRASGRKNILAIGNPKTAMAPLPGAEKEATEIAGMFEKQQIYTGSAATEGLIKKDYTELGKPDVVHLACHGLFNEAVPQLSFLALTPDQINDGKLEMHELFDLDWRGVSLVTLSACSSGKGRLGAGDDLVGLTRGFMFAGAPSILCSLWDVDDEATRALMINFYKNYLRGMPKSEALRKAQMVIRETKKWSHPYYWSAFVLFGDWE